MTRNIRLKLTWDLTFCFYLLYLSPQASINYKWGVEDGLVIFFESFILSYFIPDLVAQLCPEDN